MAIPFKEPSYNSYTDIEQLPNHVMDEICHFFTVYKELEGKRTANITVSDKQSAINTIANAMDAYNKKFLPGR